MHTDNHAREGYADNATVFGAILRGELPAKVLFEDEQVLCFRDIRPVCEHHSLVIPKRHIEHCGYLTPRDEALVRHMEHVARTALKLDFPDVDQESALTDGRLSLGFHKWPMLSVRHLHLHCIYPMPCQSWWHRFLHPQSYGWLYAPSAAFPEPRVEGRL